MSVQAMVWAIEHSQSRGSTLLVLIAIANHAGDYGEESWPGMKKLGLEARVSRNTVMAAIFELEELGEVLVYPGSGVPGRGGTTHRYELPFVPGWKRPKGIKPRKGRDPNTSSADTSFVKEAQSTDKEVQSAVERGPTDCARTVLIEPSYETTFAVGENPATALRRRLGPKPLREAV